VINSLKDLMEQGFRYENLCHLEYHPDISGPYHFCTDFYQLLFVCPQRTVLYLLWQSQTPKKNSLEMVVERCGFVFNISEL